MPPGPRRPNDTMATRVRAAYIDVFAAEGPLSFLVTRRTMLNTIARACVGASLGLATGGWSPRSAHAGLRRHVCRRTTPTGPHPDPRPGIDASHMAAADTVRSHPHAVAAFDEGRTIPEVLDGIRCQCGCAGELGLRSLLSCYEGADAMALDCDICQGEARLAYRLHGEGQTLDQIRAAIDARYGS